MAIVVGLVLLVAGAVVAVAGVLDNHGSAHALAHQFTVFGYHVTGSNGALFLYGVAVGAVALLGLSLIVGGVRAGGVRAGNAGRGPE
jgi:hypothetical protein